MHELGTGQTATLKGGGGEDGQLTKKAQEKKRVKPLRGYWQQRNEAPPVCQREACASAR